MKHPWNSQQFIRDARNNDTPNDVIDASNAAAREIKKVNSDLPVVLTLHHLGHLADVSPDFLQEVIFRKIDAYRVFRVQKKGRANKVPKPARRFRTICIPHPLLMRVQRWIAQNILAVIEPHEVSYAFARGRDLVGAAQQHAGAKWLVKMDVRRFFESISERQVYFVFRGLGYQALLAFQLARLCTRLPHNPRFRPDREAVGLPYQRRKPGHLPQGAPTSPMLANLAVQVLDSHLADVARSQNWTFTRYADDLAFSRDGAATRGEAGRLVRVVEQSLLRFGFVPHRQKTTILPPGARKILLGVLVDRDQPKLTRAFRNNLETHLYALLNPKMGAAAHQEKRGFASTIGMKRHIAGLIAFAHQVDKVYAATQYDRFNAIDWTG